MNEVATITLPAQAEVRPIYTQHPDMPRIGPPVPSSYEMTMTKQLAVDLIDELVRTFGLEPVKTMTPRKTAPVKKATKNEDGTNG